MSKNKDTANEVKPEVTSKSDLPEETTSEETTTEETAPEKTVELGSEKKEKRKIDVLRIRKSNTRNKLFESDIGKQFIAAARKEVKNSEIQQDKHWFIVWEILED